MSRFDSGVSSYATGRAVLEINFPEGDRKCKWCKMCRMDNGIRHRCQITDRILYSVEFIPPECPLKFEEEPHEQP